MFFRYSDDHDKDTKVSPWGIRNRDQQYPFVDYRWDFFY